MSNFDNPNHLNHPNHPHWQYAVLTSTELVSAAQLFDAKTGALVSASATFRYTANSPMAVTFGERRMHWVAPPGPIYAHDAPNDSVSERSVVPYSGPTVWDMRPPLDLSRLLMDADPQEVEPEPSSVDFQSPQNQEQYRAQFLNTLWTVARSLSFEVPTQPWGELVVHSGARGFAPQEFSILMSMLASAEQPQTIVSESERVEVVEEQSDVEPPKELEAFNRYLSQLIDMSKERKGNINLKNYVSSLNVAVKNLKNGGYSKGACAQFSQKVKTLTDGYVSKVEHTDGALLQILGNIKRAIQLLWRKAFGSKQSVQELSGKVALPCRAAMALNLQEVASTVTAPAA